MNSIPQDIGELIIARKNANSMRRNVELDNTGRIMTEGTGNYKVFAREVNENNVNPDNGPNNVHGHGEHGKRELSRRAKSLKACKGKKGCEFAGCLMEAFGNIPAKWQAKCPDIVNMNKNKNGIREEEK